MRLDLMERGVELLLEGMGVSLVDPNFIGTPHRVAKMYAEMLAPQHNNWATFPSKSSDLILLRGHKVIAVCPHHLMPVELTCYIGYIPHKRTIGLSKLGRVVEEQLYMPVLQEDLAVRIADSLEHHLDPKGVGVVLAGIHGCIRYRGIESDGDVVVSSMKGVLLLNPAARSEFLQCIGRP